MEEMARRGQYLLSINTDGEDMQYSKRILPMCKVEVCIDKPLYHYKYITVK
jgi:hypothetical protein